MQKRRRGFIRELYIVKDKRRVGLGSKLATKAENRLYDLELESNFKLLLTLALNKEDFNWKPLENCMVY